MKIKTGLLLAALAGIMLLQACNKEDEVDPEAKVRENEQEIQNFLADSSYTAQKTASGLYYFKTLENSAGTQPQTGNQVYVHYTGRLLRTNFLFDQSANNRPLVFGLNSASIVAGFNEGISLLSEGEKAKLIVPSSLGYSYLDLRNIPPYSVLKYDVELVAVRTDAQALRLFATDSLQLDSEQLQPVTASPGTYYVRTQEGTGVQLQNGKTATLRYRGRLIDGTRFAPEADSPNQFIQSQFVVGQGQSIKGFEEGLKLMKVGEKAILFLPASQAYEERGVSSQGQWIIPPYSPLIFDIEIISVQ